MNRLCLLSDNESRAVNAENPTGGKGLGAYWYQSEPFANFPPFFSRDALEIV